MRTKEPGESYESLSKRELQDLCKKYDLSPYDRRSNLVNSLNSYFEKKNSSPISLAEGSSAHSTSLLPQVQLGAYLSDKAGARKDNFVANRGKINELLRRKGFESYNKESCIQIYDIRRSPRLHKKETEIPESQNALQLAKNGSKCNVEPPNDSRIQIYDIRRSPSLHKKETEIPEIQNALQLAKNGSKCNVEPPNDSRIQIYDIRRSPRLHKMETEIHKMQNVSQFDKNGFECNVEPPKVSIEKKNLGFARETGVGNMPQVQNPNENAFVPSKKLSDSIPYFQYYVQSEKGINLCVEFNYTTYDQCKKMDMQFRINQNSENNKFQSFRQELESLGSNCNQAKKKSLLTNIDSETGVNSVSVQNVSLLNSIVNENGHAGFDETNEDNISNQNASYTESCHMGTKSKSDGSETLNILVDQNSKNPNAVYSGCSVSGSKEFQLPEVASIQKEDGLVANSSEFNLDISRNYTSAITEEWGCKNPVSGTKASDSPSKTNSVGDLVSNVRCKRKTADSEIANSGGQHDGRVFLRSGKRFGQSILRRSMRVVSKV